MIVNQGWQQESRIAYLESIRGLAALQVLLLHFFAAFAPGLVFPMATGSGIAAAIHLSPFFFLYDGYSAVYIFFALSGYVLTRSFERHLAQPAAQVLARIVRLGLPAVAATLIAAAVMLIFGRPNVPAGSPINGMRSFRSSPPSRTESSMRYSSVIEIYPVRPFLRPGSSRSSSPLSRRSGR